jgi:4-hydroxybenzoate polyprenyltransferase
MKSRWAIYLTERFPLIPNLLIALGITMSAKQLSGNEIVGWTPFTLAVFGGMVFLAQIRFMDELKDFEKDKVAHPERPLPRGLFTLEEFGRFIRVSNAGMVFVSVLAAALVSIRAGIYFAFGAFYLFLMFKEFYLKDWLGGRPILYAISHQFIIIPMTAFVMECFLPGAVEKPIFIQFSGLLLCSFFAFEVGRKLNPSAHPVLNTYLHRYGRERTAFLILILLGLSVKAGEKIGLLGILGPLYILILILLALLWWAPGKFKWIEGFVTLFLLLAIWGLPIVRSIP